MANWRNVFSWRSLVTSLACLTHSDIHFHPLYVTVIRTCYSELNLSCQENRQKEPDCLATSETQKLLVWPWRCFQICPFLLLQPGLYHCYPSSNPLIHLCVLEIPPLPYPSQFTSPPGRYPDLFLLCLVTSLLLFGYHRALSNGVALPVCFPRMVPGIKSPCQSPQNGNLTFLSK